MKFYERKQCQFCGLKYFASKMLPGGRFCSSGCLINFSKEKVIVEKVIVQARVEEYKKQRFNCKQCNRSTTRVKQKPFCSRKCKKKNQHKRSLKDAGLIPKKKKTRPNIDLWSDQNRDRWMQVRYEVFRRYGRKCAVCGETNGKLHVDHIKPKSKYPELMFDIENLQILCIECNYGKGNRFEDDWRDHR